MATSRFWSNALNIGSTFVVAYALLMLAMLHHHGQHGPHGPEGSHPACPVHHFAWLALATGLTGLAAGCSLKRRYLYLFPVLLLVTELFVLVHISRGAAHHVRQCSIMAERVDATATVQRAEIAPGLTLVREQISVSDPYVDTQVRDHCVQGVRHAVILACLVVGVICTALSCCGSRLASTLAAEKREEAAVASCEEGAIIERRPLKRDPLDESDVDAPVVGKVVLIHRV